MKKSEKPAKEKPKSKGDKTSVERIRIAKLVLSMGVGEAGPKLEKSEKLLKKRVPTWGLRPGLEIGLKSTLRRQKAIELLKRLLDAVEFRLSPKSFDESGNVNFGIKEYITVPGVDYDPTVGITGFNVNVCLEKIGYRVSRRRLFRSRIGKKQRVSREDAMSFMKKEFNVEVIE